MAKKMCMWYTEHADDIDSASGIEAVVTDGGTAAALLELFTRKQVGGRYMVITKSQTPSVANVHCLFYDALSIA